MGPADAGAREPAPVDFSMESSTFLCQNMTGLELGSLKLELRISHAERHLSRFKGDIAVDVPMRRACLHVSRNTSLARVLWPSRLRTPSEPAEN